MNLPDHNCKLDQIRFLPYKLAYSKEKNVAGRPVPFVLNFTRQKRFAKLLNWDLQWLSLSYFCCCSDGLGI